MGQSGNQGSGLRLDVDDVFSTDLWVGTGSDVVVTTGIDLQNEGGIVWVKNRGRSYTDHTIWTRNDQTGWLKPNTTASITNQNWIRDWTTTTYTAAGASTNYASYSGDDYVGWTFRKAPKFFDVVTYTGDGSTTKTVSHNLGSTPAMIFFKRTDSTGNWVTWHKDTPLNGYTQSFMRLNSDVPITSLGDYGNSLVPTSTFIRTPVHSNSGNTADSVNVSGATYVAYLFAHNDGDGEFGPDADQDIIKCGIYAGNGSTSGNPINVGFEPQWLLIKKVNNSGHWTLFDNIRGMPEGSASDASFLLASDNVAEAAQFKVSVTSVGFSPSTSESKVNSSGSEYIYMAIRRGSLFPPTDATKVFSIDTRGSTGDGNEPAYRSTFPVDFALQKDIDSGTNWTAKTRLLSGKDLNPNTTGAEQSASYNLFDYMNGHFARTNTASDEQSWMWKRAPGFFDVVAYTGDGASNRQISHNLGVQPEMIWIKCRSATDSWHVSTPSIWDDALFLNTTDPINTGVSGLSGANNLTATNFSVASGGACNGSGQTYIAYLFATVAGVSKVGSFVGSDSDQTIDCGFSSGARFVLIKCTTSAQNWAVWDTTRGIVSGNEPYLVLDRLDAQITGQDRLDPHSSGFTVAGNFTTGNDAGESYIFYAIA